MSYLNKYPLQPCCENVIPNIRKDLLGRVLIYCPHCGYSVMGDNMQDAADQWNDDAEVRD